MNNKKAAELLEGAEINQTPVVLYGAGKYGKIALFNIKIRWPKINIVYFLDDNLERNNKDIAGIKVISSSEAVKIPNVIVVVSNYYVEETLKRLEVVGIDLARVVFINDLLIEFVETELIIKQKKLLSEVYDLLTDYESKMIYKTMIESRFTGNIDVLARTCHADQYFPRDIFQFSDDEVFVDAGAFDGDTINEFRNVTEDHFKYIYAFEPDRNNYERLTAEKYGESILLFNMGLYNEDNEMPFLSGKGGSSKINSTGEDCGYDAVKVCAFDNLELPCSKISFVKMDIEGSELNALLGMERTICECRPKLAICIYHKFADLWEIPLYIKQLVPEYRLYIRNHTTYMDEIVLYATL